MRFRNVINQFHDHNGLSHTSTAKGPDFSALDKRTNQIDDFNPRLQNLRLRILFNQGRRRTMDRIFLVIMYRTALINRFTDNVEDASKDTFANR